jgi:hypothetical protein
LAISRGCATAQSPYSLYNPVAISAGLEISLGYLYFETLGYNKLKYASMFKCRLKAMK